MDGKAKIEEYLRENGVPYELTHHPLAFTAQDVASSEHIPGQMVAKVVMVAADEKMVMLVLPAPQHVDLKKAATLVGAKSVRLAREAEFSGLFPGCDVGAEPPFGNLFGVPAYVDESLTRDETIVFRAGTHTDTISMKFADYERLAKPSRADFAEQH